MSKEEIEKAKGRCNSIIEFCENNKECKENNICPDCYIEIEDIKAIKTLLQYIKQLELENKDTYWKGYIQKQNEAVKICKMCKYKKQYFERNAKEHE